MALLNKWIVLFVIISHFLTVSAQRNEEELELSSFLGNCDSQIKSLKSSLRVLRLKPIDNEQEIRHQSNEIRNLTRNAIRRASAVSIETIQDDFLKRQLWNLKRSQLFLDESHMNAFNNVSKKMNGILLEKNVCTYEDRTNCSLAYIPHLQDILMENSNPDMLTYYWTMWHKTNSRQANSFFEEWLQLLKKDAEINHSASPLVQRYSQYENPEFLYEIENEIMKMRPLYEELHTYIRMVMRVYFGDKLIQSHASVPEQFLQYVLNEINRNNVFAHEVRKIFQNSNNTAIDEVLLTSASIPVFENFDFESNQLNLQAAKTDEICFSKTNTADKQSEFIQAWQRLFSHEYERNMIELPLGVNTEPCPGFRDAILRAITLSITTPQYLQKINLIENYEYNEGMMYYHLFQTALTNIMALPVNFVNEKFIADALEDNIDSANFSCVYWKMMDQFAGIKPAISKPEEKQLTMTFLFHGCTGETVAPIKKLFTEIVSFQIYKALCKKANQEIQWQNCDFSKNTEAATLLKSAMKLGSTKSWRDVLYLITGERNINIDPLMEYYKPLILHLQRLNKNAGTLLGWELSYKCDK